MGLVVAAINNATASFYKHQDLNQPTALHVNWATVLSTRFSEFDLSLDENKFSRSKPNRTEMQIPFSTGAVVSARDPWYRDRCSSIGSSLEFQLVTNLSVVKDYRRVV